MAAIRSGAPSPLTGARLHEQELINAFVIPLKRRRLILMLGLKPEKRRSALNSLNHFRGLDPRFAYKLEPSKQKAAAIARLLRSKGAPANC